jgi:arylformamidase
VTSLYDISPPVTPEMAVFPGDTPLTREVLMDTRRGDNLTLSTIRATVHLGAHADGPNHYGPLPDGSEAPAIDERPLDLYIGECIVVRASVTPAEGLRVGVDDLDLPDALPPRVLICTGTYPDPRVFNQDFAGLEPGLIETLHERGVRTIGVDTPSVDPPSSKVLESHKVFLRLDMAIIEGLVLTDVPEGRYELIALPLKLVGFDASPVRAVLRSMD